LDYDGQYEYSEIIKVQGLDYQEENLNFYPNPASDKLYFNQSISEVVILSTEGKVIVRESNQSSLDISKLVKGFYIVELSSEFKTRSLKMIKN